MCVARSCQLIPCANKGLVLTNASHRDLTLQDFDLILTAAVCAWTEDKIWIDRVRARARSP